MLGTVLPALVGVGLAAYCAVKVASEVSPAFLTRRLGGMFPPSFDGVTLREIGATVATVLAAAAMGVSWGTFLYLFRALPREESTVRRWSAAVASLLARGFPEVAVLFCLQLFFGTRLEILLICVGLYTGGVLSRLLDITVTDDQREPYRRVRQAGATHAVAFVAVLTASVDLLLFRACLLRLDSVLRKVVILGVAGAGGIGLSLQEHYAYGDIAVVGGLCLLLLCFHAGLESLAALAGTGGHAPVPPTARRYAVGFLQGTGVLGWLFCLGRLATGSRPLALPYIDLPPLTYLGQRLAAAAMETVASALAAASIGIIAGSLIGLAASVELCRPRWLPYVIRLLLAVSRAVPDVLLVILAISAVGFGWSSGAVVLAVLSTITAAKLFADEVDSVGVSSYQALRALGASPLQSLTSGLLPQLGGQLTSIAYWQIEHNLRNAVLIGSVGAGGLGYFLVEARNAGSLPALVAGGLLACLLVGMVELLGRGAPRQP
ncbi:ABC transporter permease subunit [Micromonospora sp. CPCC 205561]|uniref:ABC transporter permease subunit n=1 Tax=Micromonospora sp. CPCC 205561 TaxID=3122407 RepID=UPI002FF09073